MGCFYSANKSVIDLKWENKNLTEENKGMTGEVGDHKLKDGDVGENNEKNIKQAKEYTQKYDLIEHTNKNWHTGYISPVEEISFKKTTCNTGNMSNNRKFQKSNIDFGDKLLKEVNLIRVDPPDYANKIEKMMGYIKHNSYNDDKNSPYTLEYKNLKKIGLSTGKSAFISSIEILKDLTSMTLLQWNEEIKIDLTSCEDFTSESFQKLIENKKELLGSKYPLFSVNIDVIPDPEISALLQLVDDTPFQGHRREAILNTEFSYMAVSQGKDRKKRLFTLISFA